MSAKIPYPSPTKTWHTDTYPAISSAGRAKGKTIVITGASGGIGRATAISFAKGGAAHIALLGRKKEALLETQRQVTAANAETSSAIFVCDSTDIQTLGEIAGSVRSWDVLVLCAGLLPAQTPIETAPLDDWWGAFETNVKGTFISTQVFLPKANEDSKNGPPSILYVTAMLPFTPNIPVCNGNSAYNASKVAGMQMMQHLAQEQPDINVLSIHPGVVTTAMSSPTPEFEAMVAEMRKDRMVDTAEMAADFLVWASTAEAGFLKGRFVAANWDVEELMAKKDEIEGSEALMLRPQGWPFGL